VTTPVVATIGAIATIPMHLGPNCYRIALTIAALPFTWLGGALYQKKAHRSIAETTISGCPGGAADGRAFRLSGTTAQFFL
jgi:hypothetical protein